VGKAVYRGAETAISSPTIAPATGAGQTGTRSVPTEGRTAHTEVVVACANLAGATDITGNPPYSIPPYSSLLRR
jgi:hypothetical protein